MAGSDDVVMESAPLTVQEKAWVASSEERSVTLIVNEELPAADGVPVSAPVEVLRLMPEGRDPAETDQM